MKQNGNWLICIFILTCIIIGQTNLLSQTSISGLKKGDWFDCEMEFENIDMPVFRNHYLLQEDKQEYLALVAVRFTYMGNQDESTEWDYKVLRYKLIEGFVPRNERRLPDKEFKLKNLSSLDTWYPDFFINQFDSIRNSYKGKLYFDKDNELTHEFKYDDHYQNYRTVLPAIDVGEGSEFGTVSSNSGNMLRHYIEQITSLIFKTDGVKPESNFGISNYQIKNINTEADREKKFIIGKRNFSAYLLPNGLPYAFSDEHQHKVFAISNASFNIPNNAVITVVNNAKLNDENKFPDLIWMEKDNPAFVTEESGEPGFIELDSGVGLKQLKLKCGTSFKLFYNGDRMANIYLEPGDTVNITINDDDNIKVSNNNNSIWWQKNSKPSAEDMDQSLITPEFKSYLKLQNETAKVSSSLKNMANDSVQLSILKFYGLKSYHYNSIGKNDFRGLLEQYTSKKQAMAYKSGSPYRTGFKYAYYNEVMNNTGFMLYFNLNRCLTSRQYSFYNLIEREEFYSDYLKMCGDTLIKKKIDNLLTERTSIQVDRELPYKIVLNAQRQNINLQPKKNKYGLLFMYKRTKPNKEFDLLKDSLNENIQTVYYRTLDNYGLYADKDSSNTALANAGHLSFSGYPTEISRISLETFGAILILYDDNGKILYCEQYNNEFSYSNGERIVDVSRYVSEINEAIQKSEQQSKSKLLSVLWIVLTSALVIALIAFVIFRIVLYRVKKKNEQLRMIQELKLQSVQSQLNPHFIFNALNSIQELIYAEQTKLANKYLLGFSALLRGVLDNSNKRLVALSDEINIVTRYCELEKLRSDFDFKVEQELKTSADLIEVPYMLLQPVVENCIKHGVSKKECSGEVKILITEKDSVLNIKIRDNGPGFINNPVLNGVNKGKGLRLMVDKLTSIFDNDYDFELQNLPEGGAEVFVQFKIG